MSDQPAPKIDFDDNEYVWPVGDVPGVPPEQLAPPMPASANVTDEEFSRQWNAYNRLRVLFDGDPEIATLLNWTADEIERLRKDNAELKDILAVAMNTARTL